MDKDAREHAAKRICQRCPVIVECREWALRRREQYGVWGGMGEAERARASGNAPVSW